VYITWRYGVRRKGLSVEGTGYDTRRRGSVMHIVLAVKMG